MVAQGPKKKNVHSSVNVNSKVVDELVKVTSSRDLTLVAGFVQHGSMIKVLSNWSYFASLNDHHHFSDCSLKMSRLTYMANVISGIYSDKDYQGLSQIDSAQLQPMIVTFYKELLHGHLKAIYRALSSCKPSLTNPVLRILTDLVSNKSLVSEFLDLFDINLSVLPKLLIPTKAELENGLANSSKDFLSIRHNFIKFWLALNSNASAFTRKTLLTRYHSIMNNLWKYLSIVDSTSTLTLIFNFIDSKILEEVVFRKSIKCKILNENFMFKAQLIFNRQENEEFKEFFMKFMTKLATDLKRGLLFPNDRTWQFPEVEGVAIVINNTSFKICNKLLYTLLTAIKPWESSPQLQFCIDILRAAPELVLPYLNWMIQHGGGYHDPTLSSWWIGHTLLYCRILQLPLPQSIMELSEMNFINDDVQLNLSRIVDNIALPPLSKSSLSKCIDFEYDLVSQLSLQLIMFALRKLKAFLSLGIMKYKQSLTDLVFLNLPDLSYLVQLYNKLGNERKPKERNVMILTLSMIFKEYEELYPKISSASLALTKITVSESNQILKKDFNSLKGYDIALLDNYLSIQFSQQLEQNIKWWHKPNSGNSFFTCLVKLSATSLLDNYFRWKLINILESLTTPYLFLNKRLIVSPIIALIESLKLFGSNESIWNVLDEVISRSTKFPYRFLDKSHKTFNDINVFTICLVDQLKVVLKQDTGNTKLIMRWLFLYFRYLVVIGEPIESIVDLGNDLINEDERYLSIAAENHLWNALEFQIPYSQHKNQSFFEKIINVSYVSLIKDPDSLGNSIPVTKFDFAGLALKLKMIVRDPQIKDAESVMFNLFSKMGNFLMGVIPNDESLKSYLFSKYFWSEILHPGLISDHRLNTKQYLAASLLNETFQQIFLTTPQDPKYIKELTDFVSQAITNTESIHEENQAILSKFFWLFSKETIKSLIKKLSCRNQIVSIRFLELLYNESIITPMEIFNRMITLEANTTIDDQKHRIICNMIEKNLVDFSFKKWSHYFDLALENREQQYLLKSLTKNETVDNNDKCEYLKKKLENLVSKDILFCTVGAAIISCPTLNSDEKLTIFFKQMVSTALNLVSAKNFGHQLTFGQLLEIFAFCLRENYISEIDNYSLILEKVFNYVETQGCDLDMSSAFASLVYEVLSKVDAEERLAVWLQKAMLVVTKRFAESNEWTNGFRTFVVNIQRIVELLLRQSSSIWKFIPPSIINTQLEVLLSQRSWVNEVEVLKYANSLLLTGSKADVDFEKLLHIFVTNEANELTQLPSETNSLLRIHSALIIYILFHLNPHKTSTAHLVTILLKFYLGSIRVEDILLKKVLIKYEEIVPKSWMSFIKYWDFTEGLSDVEKDSLDEQKLITGKQVSEYKITLNKKFLLNTVDNPKLFQDIELPDHLLKLLIESPSEDNCLDAFDILLGIKSSYPKDYQHTIYDPEFLFLLIINSEDFVKVNQSQTSTPEYLLNLKQLFDSNLLQLMITCLGSQSETLKKISKILLSGALKSCNTAYKDYNLYKVYISNALFTLRSCDNILPMVWFIYASFALIISDPEHFLFDRVCRYISSRPMIKVNELPLYSDITFASVDNIESEGSKNYHKEIAWLLERFIMGIQNMDDLNVLKRHGVIEWVLNLLNSPYVSLRIRTLLLKLLYTIEGLESGSDLLITRYALFASIDQNAVRFAPIPPLKYHELEVEQLKLNFQQLQLRLFSAVGSSKRIRNWTSNDIYERIKKIRMA
ncbi:uncharacterized protein PRCAT00001566001 [Priceomyces carsonii]|uniref:uncharacterized protein n=1 Tax=Priceomyces carsonii TaxID=28549 RepID=UPI002EDA673D|nr:unnamed protein product [Priceomyces carsonii]